MATLTTHVARRGKRVMLRTKTFNSRQMKWRCHGPGMFSVLLTLVLLQAAANLSCWRSWDQRMPGKLRFWQLGIYFSGGDYFQQTSRDFLAPIRSSGGNPSPASCVGYQDRSSRLSHHTPLAAASECLGYSISLSHGQTGGVEIT